MDKKRFKKLEKETLHNIETNLKKIYNSQEGNMSNMYKLDIKKSSWMKKFLMVEIFLLIFLAGVIFLLYFLKNGREDSKASMMIHINSPAEYSSGDEVIMDVEYQNREPFALNDVEISLKYPQGFEFLASDPMPSNEFKDIWRMGNLSRGQKGKISIKGKVIGEVGNFIIFKASATYQPQNFSSSFKQEFISNTGQITASIVTIDIEGPDKVIPDQEVTYKIQYANSSQEDVSNIFIKAQFPKNFVFIESRPNFTKKDILEAKKLFLDEEGSSNSMEKNWLLDKLAKEERGNIEIIGKYMNSENEKSDITFQIAVVSEKDYTVYQEKKINFEVLNHGLNISMSVNGSKTENSINFSDTLNYSITFKNIGNKTLYDLDIIALLASQVVDWNTLIDKNGSERVSEKLLWRASSTPSLAILKPLDEGTIDFSIQIKNISKINIQKDNLKTVASAEAIIRKIDDFETNISVKTEPLLSNINTELEMKVEGRYFDDDNIAVGQGPLPPVVGKKTTLRMYWYLSNNLNEVSNVILKTNLSPYSKWEDKFSNTVGTLTFNQLDNSITWKIPKISPNKTFEDLNAWFDVSITPTEDQIGKLVLLVTEQSLVAKDNMTNSAISIVGRGVTTNLEDDVFGGGRGLVEK